MPLSTQRAYGCKISGWVITYSYGLEKRRIK
jgi:hypothetical protein